MEPEVELREGALYLTARSIPFSGVYLQYMAVHRQVHILIRTISSSPDLLGIISDSPADSQDLLLQDVDFLFSDMAHLTKDELFVSSTLRILLIRGASGISLLAAPRGQWLIFAKKGHAAAFGEKGDSLDPEKDGIPLKKVMDACAACFEQRTIFTQQVLAKALNQLIPVPVLFMRTVMQAIGAFPALVDFGMEIMSHIVSKQIWKYPKCAILSS
ncbi:hypothetical protein BRADI_3g00320v3 [Brachypodium distachyon]|uniref:Symplekin C-terminal domain-containing protein n=1 Tax=Brachypodium distachyon TaxID=15368 RepID=I1HVY6_BRADI|nr:hypothetical protein BRADI_3g00320v3 [Brachypodium distachyon]